MSAMLGSLDLDSFLSPLQSREKSQASQGEEEVCDMFPSLTYKHRVIGCASCMGVGYLISFGSFFRFGSLLMGNPVPFILNATIGSLVSLGGSFFLVGPKKQINKMFHERRRIATILYLGSLFLTLVVAFAFHNVPGQGPLLILLMVCQYVAIGWYCLSYIPFAREMAQRLFNRVYSELADDES
mmetsp:Transcript_8470/g.15352  ORF Transcript_8470/g.15352 Transcript_8470/m.15352 type:complete len:184 (+) Transcript_8470:115-666(+)